MPHIRIGDGPPTLSPQLGHRSIFKDERALPLAGHITPPAVSPQLGNALPLAGRTTPPTASPQLGHRNIVMDDRTLPLAGRITPPPPGQLRAMSPKQGYRIILQPDVRDSAASPQPRTRPLSRGTSPQQQLRIIGRCEAADYMAKVTPVLLTHTVDTHQWTKMQPAVIPQQPQEKVRLSKAAETQGITSQSGECRPVLESRAACAEIASVLKNITPSTVEQEQEEAAQLDKVSAASLKQLTSQVHALEEKLAKDSEEINGQCERIEERLHAKITFELEQLRLDLVARGVLLEVSPQCTERAVAAPAALASVSEVLQLRKDLSSIEEKFNTELADLCQTMVEVKKQTESPNGNVCVDPASSRCDMSSEITPKDQAMIDNISEMLVGMVKTNVAHVEEKQNAFREKMEELIETVNTNSSFARHTMAHLERDLRQHVQKNNEDCAGIAQRLCSLESNINSPAQSNISSPPRSSADAFSVAAPPKKFAQHEAVPGPGADGLPYLQPIAVACGVQSQKETEDLNPDTKLEQDFWRKFQILEKAVIHEKMPHS